MVAVPLHPQSFKIAPPLEPKVLTPSPETEFPLRRLLVIVRVALPGSGGKTEALL